MKKQTILVTGGAGFIGSHIVDACIDAGYRVVVMDNLSTGRKAFVHPKARFYQGDIRNTKRLGEIFQKERPQYVSHHAAQMDLRKSVKDPVFDAENNIIGTLNLLEHCIRYNVEKIVFASTGGALYGDASILPTPETYPARPVSPYGVGKLTGEQYLHYYHTTHGLSYVALRYGNVYGPRQNPHGEAGVVAIFAKKILQGQQPVINGDGRQTRDFVYVDDVVRANLLALRKGFVGSVNIGTGKETDINTIFHLLVELAGEDTKEKHGPEKSGEQKRSALQCSLARKKLGWHASAQLVGGLRETLAYFQRIQKE